MSETLSDGHIYIKTIAGAAATAEHSFHQFWLSGGGADIEVSLHAATDAIYEAAHDPQTFDNPAMRRLRAYVQGLNLVTVEDSEGRGQHGGPLERFTPSSRAWSAFRQAHAIKGEADIDFLGVKLTPRDFAELVDYVMTNTVLWAEDIKAEQEDPRVAMVDKFRGQTIAAEGQAAA